MTIFKFVQIYKIVTVPKMSYGRKGPPYMRKVYLEPDLHQIPAFEGSMSTGHSYDLCFLHQQVLRPVCSASQQLKGSELLEW